MIKVAITGNIASGKSVVENIIKNKGFAVYDADLIAHEVLNSSAKVKDEFKNYDILTNKQIDRKKLANIVFNNKEKLKLLESIIHPEVKKEFLKIFESHKNDKLVFISASQLFESGMQNLFDKTLLISADIAVRLKRLMKRNNLSKEDAQKRIDSQIGEEEKIKKCDYVITNNSTPEMLESEVNKVLKELENLNN